MRRSRVKKTTSSGTTTYIGSLYEITVTGSARKYIFMGPNRVQIKESTGKELDDTTGLYFYGARYYDPSLGRFITADPTIQKPYDPQDLNRYTYCRNNPINYTDPTGLSWFSKI